MKKILVLALSLVLLGCTNSKTETPEDVDFKTPTESQVRVDKNPKIAGLGQACGGQDKKACDLSYICEFTKNSAYAGGTCIDTVVDKNIECPENRDPVCGIRGGQMNGYQNECQLKRHGAEFVKKGFCSPDATVEKNCEAKAVGIGTCFESFVSFEFDGTSCVQKNVNGCEAEIPFETLESCESTCN